MCKPLRFHGQLRVKSIKINALCKNRAVVVFCSVSVADFMVFTVDANGTVTTPACLLTAKINLFIYIEA